MNYFQRLEEIFLSEVSPFGPSSYSTTPIKDLPTQSTPYKWPEPIKPHSFKSFYKKSSGKTLFHGTVIDNLSNIKENGLVAKVGKFVQTMYNDEGIEPEPIVYFADKKGLDKAVSAMRFHVGEKIGKWVGEVTLQDIRKHGLLLKVSSDDIEQRPEDPSKDQEDYPYGVEPGDYYTFEDILPDGYIYGDKLVNFLHRNGLVSEFGDTMKGTIDPLSRKKLQGRVIGHILNNNSNPKEEVVSRVTKMTDKELMSLVRKWGL